MNGENLQSGVGESDELTRQSTEAAENNQRLIKEARDTVEAADRFIGIIQAEPERQGENATEVGRKTALDLIGDFKDRKAEAEVFLAKVDPKTANVEQENTK